jgi:hypothetical protein
MVRVLGDLSGLSKSFKDAGAHAESSAGKARAAFSNMLGMLNRSGVLGPFGESLAIADEAMAHIAEHGKKVSDVMIGAGGALVAAGGLFSALGSKEQAAHQQLAQAIANTGHSYEDYGKAIEEAIKHNEKFGQSSEATQNALQVLTQATGDPAKALQLLGTATDLAAAKHEDLSSAATALGKVYNGNTKLLKEFGIHVTATTALQKQEATAAKGVETAGKQLAAAKQKLADLEAIDHAKKHLTIADQIALRNAQDNVVTATQNATDAHTKLADAQQAVAKATTGHGTAVDQLSAKLRGQAAASADTFTGHLKAIKTEVEDQAAKFGQKYGPALQGAGAAMAGLGTAIKITQAAVEAFKGAEEAATAATDAQAAAEVTAEAAGLPLIATIGLVVLAVAALGAIAYVVYRNWDTIWKAIKLAVEVVWNWIKTNWPLLVGILLGPIGLAAALIYKYWDQIRGGLEAVIKWIQKNWPIIVAVLTGGVSLAVTQIIQHWQGLVDFFTGLPGQIAAIFSKVWHGIVDAFKAVINAVIDVWNSLHFTLPKVSLLGVHVGGETIGVPHIPHLAQGGLITQTGLVFAHAGEAITPIDKAPRGPAVNIEHAHFSTEIDVEAFVRKAAWVVQTQRV